MPSGSNEPTPGASESDRPGEPPPTTRTGDDASPEPPAPATAWRGARLDRYVVIDRLGSGGMGEVYLAYDPELDRRVAIKLLRRNRQGDDAQSRERLLGEAQALARLAHPNVVAVHDVGTAALVSPGRAAAAEPAAPLVFVAMEFVDGSTVCRWRTDAAPHWREIVEVFIAAGEGLAAAHRAGIVHRDFKPTNVMVSGSGGQRRVRVLDFGLARRAGDHGRAAQPDARTSAEGAERSGLTDPGFVMGTPAYMAPEQLVGQEADAASDQYAFCVSLYEALFGRRPFEGTAFAELARTVPRLMPAEPPAGTRVPRRIRAAIMRGLATQRSQRFASVDALLQQLRSTLGPRRARVRWLASGAVVAGLAGWWVVDRYADAPCVGAERKLAGIWDDDLRQRIADAFAATNTAFSDEAWRSVEPTLDAYAQQWVQRHRDACEATRVRGEQSEELMDLRIACLGQRLGGLGSLTDLFAEADPAVVEHAHEAAQGLAGLASCDDRDYLEAAVKPPSDARLATEVDGLRRQLQRAEALRSAGKYDEALALAYDVLEKARSIRYRPLVADAALEVGRLHDWLERGDEALAGFSEALDVAARIGHTRVEARALAEIARWSGTRGQDADAAARYASFARAVMDRAGSTLAFDTELELNLGSAYFQTGHYEPAMRHLRHVVEIAGDDPTVQAQKLTALQNIGAIEGARGNIEASADALREALRQHVERLGPHHPSIAVISANLAASLIQVGQHDEADEHARHAQEIWTASFGADHPFVARALQSRATIAAARGRLDEALETIDRALAIKRAALGKDDPSVAYAEANRGDVLFKLGRHREARQQFERALRIFEATFGSDHGTVGHVLISLAEVDRANGDDARAIERLERALTLMRSNDMDAAAVAKVEFELARVLQRSDPERAAALARQARARHAEQPQPSGDKIEAIDAWLRAHGLDVVAEPG